MMGVLIVIIGIVVNRWFLMIYGKTLWTMNRPGGVDTLLAVAAIGLLLVVFPLLYVFSLKTGLVLSVLWTIRWSYRDRVTGEIVDGIAPKVVWAVSKWSSYKLDVQHAVSNWKSKFPLVGRLAINQLLKKVPLLEKLVETIEWLDTSSFENEEQFKTTVKASIQPYLEKTSVWSAWWWNWLVKLAVINAIVLAVLALLIFV